LLGADQARNQLADEKTDQSGATGCAPLKAGNINGVASLALSPDGKWLYAAGEIGFAFRIVR